MYTKRERIAQIDAYHQQIGALVNSFQASHILPTHIKNSNLTAQISALLNIQNWQTRYENARANDQVELMTRLDDLQVNQSKLLSVLSACDDICHLLCGSQLCRRPAE